MRTGNLSLALAASIAVFLFLTQPASLRGQTPDSVALTGQVTSAEEGPLEGVLVSVKKAGSTVTISVVSDEQGKYRFPRKKLDAGQYSLRIRAVGYDLEDPGAVEVTAGKTGTINLKLRKTQDLAAQLTNAEWILSMPGAEEQKGIFRGCVGCHSLDRVVRSRYTAEEWVGVLTRMAGYAPPSSPSRPVRDPAAEPVNPERLRQQGEYLATINLSATSKWAYPLTTLPRPKGSATRVILTEYDLPRRDAQPHDAVMDSAGVVWYSDFAMPVLGKLNPRTAETREYSVPVLNSGRPPGSLDLDFDPDGNVWLGRLMQGGVAKFDRETEKFTSWSAPKEHNNDAVRTAMVAARSSRIDGKVWFDNASANRVLHRVDVKSGEVETIDPYAVMGKDSADGGRAHSIYGIETDGQNNIFFTDMAGGNIGKVETKTGKVTFYPTPTPNAGPRRINLDSQGRLWFGEFYVNKIGMLDPKTGEIKEWTVSTPWSNPYDAAADKNGEAWAGGMHTDRVVRLNPKTGQFTEYLLPRSTNIRRVNVDNSTTPVTFWVGNNHGASIIKLEPLD